MASTDLKALMGSHQRMLDICHDPDLNADAKLFALCTVAIIHDTVTNAATRASIKRGRWLSEICDMTGRDGHWVRRVIRHDIPRYAPAEPTGYCTAPMIRREGLCGKTAVIRGIERDPFTGEGTPYGYCSRHRNHDDDWRIQQQLKQWNQNGRPEPAPNAGGVLRRYFDLDWGRLYHWAAPDMTPAEGVKPPTLPKPKFVVLQGGKDV